MNDAERVADEEQRSREATLEERRAKDRAERRARLVERLSVMLYLFSTASVKPLTPVETFQRAEAFVAGLLKIHPDSDLDLP